MSTPIEDYALIGDCRSAALVARNGSIDWLCWPRFDSEACFAALLGSRDHGRWLVAPRDKARITRQYRPNTLILETCFETADGAAVLVDFMPFHGERSEIVRLVHGTRGRVRMHTELILRFGYGAVVPWVTRLESGAARDRWAGHGVAAHARASQGQEFDHGRRVHRRARGNRSAGLELCALPPARPARARSNRFAGGNRKILEQLDREMPSRRRMVRRRASLDDHAQGAHLRADRWHRRRADHLAAGADRRRTQLGLSFLLAARRHADAARRHACRLLRRGGGLARMAVTRGGR